MYKIYTYVCTSKSMRSLHGIARGFAQAYALFGDNQMNTRSADNERLINEEEYKEMNAVK